MNHCSATGSAACSRPGRLLRPLAATAAARLLLRRMHHPAAGSGQRVSTWSWKRCSPASLPSPPPPPPFSTLIKKSHPIYCPPRILVYNCVQPAVCLLLHSASTPYDGHRLCTPATRRSSSTPVCTGRPTPHYACTKSPPRLCARATRCHYSPYATPA